MALKPETIQRYKQAAANIGAHFERQTAGQKVLIVLQCGHKKEINTSQLVQASHTIRCRVCADQQQLEWHKSEVARLEKELSIIC
jgi:hypothetical protein